MSSPCFPPSKLLPTKSCVGSDQSRILGEVRVGLGGEIRGVSPQHCMLGTSVHFDG